MVDVKIKILSLSNKGWIGTLYFCMKMHNADSIEIFRDVASVLVLIKRVAVENVATAVLAITELFIIDSHSLLSFFFSPKFDQYDSFYFYYYYYYYYYFLKK
jgi:hypothetical protein